MERWGQPGQQHGLRMSSISSEHTRSTCRFLVSGFLTEMVQQIHSLRASGVMSSHAARAAGEARSAFLKSVGKVCTVPLESAFLTMRRFYDVRCSGNTGMSSTMSMGFELAVGADTSADILPHLPGFPGTPPKLQPFAGPPKARSALMRCTYFMYPACESWK